jgi:hypothetical protein
LASLLSGTLMPEMSAACDVMVAMVMNPSCDVADISTLELAVSERHDMITAI